MKIDIIADPVLPGYRRYRARFRSTDVNNPKQPRKHMLIGAAFKGEPSEEVKEEFGELLAAKLQHWIGR